LKKMNVSRFPRILITRQKIMVRIRLSKSLIIRHWWESGTRRMDSVSLIDIPSIHPFHQWLNNPPPPPSSKFEEESWHLT
jgi:hypothetical protein